MGISASTLSREPDADRNAASAVETTVTEAATAAASATTATTASAVDAISISSALDRTSHCVRPKPSCNSGEASQTTSSDAEMSDRNDDGVDADDYDVGNSSSSSDTNNYAGSSQRQGRRRRDDAERESVAELDEVDRAAEVTDRDHHHHHQQQQRSTKNPGSNNGGQSLDEFREELRIKREQRRTAIADLKNEVLQLRGDLAAEREISRALRASTGRRDAGCEGAPNSDDDVVMVSTGGEADADASADNDDDAVPADASGGRSVETVLRMQLANVNHQLQLANGDVLSLTAELAITQKQVGTLKEVIAVSKEMVNIREAQLEQLKTKLKEIEDSLAERELAIMSDTLRKEYDRQLTNIRSLRTLYEERARVSAAEKENLLRQLETKRTELETEIEKSQGLEARVATLEAELQESVNNLTNMKDDLIDCKAEKKGLEEETAVINQLFSQLLSGFNGGNDLNIDKLASMLEDNRDLLSDITSSESCKNRAAAMPKLLLDLVSQIDEKTDDVGGVTLPLPDDTASTSTSAAAAPSQKQQIYHNLPKVWKVLIELLNHQKSDPVPFKEDGQSEDCYKVVQSPTGPQHVLSVSKTYIRLKDLIVEKKFLQKETHKLKNLNSHLETRLDQKERRLATVTVELNKTWTLVGRMQRQHRQLHTNEQVLRYQLSQKRRMLTELKEELEYCRRKWTLAREKNDESQTQWNTLRREFNARKLQDSGNQQSAESGYSDDPASDEEQVAPEAMPLKDDALPAAVVASGSNFVVEEELDAAEAPLVIAMPVIVHHDADLQQEATASTSTGSSSCGSQSGKKDVKPSKLSRELRKRKPQKPPKVVAAAESLEAMFYRISGQEQPESEQSDGSSSEESEYDDDDIDEAVQILQDVDFDAVSEEITARIDPVNITANESTSSPNPLPQRDAVDPEDEERRQRRAVRFERMEEQCQQLIQQVMRTSSRGEELNKQLDNVHNRYKAPSREQLAEHAASVAAAAAASETTQQASTSAGTTSVATDAKAEADTTCLTAREQEYTSRRAARLQRLEEECKAFLNRVSASNSLVTSLNDKATTLHEHHAARLAGRDQQQQRSEDESRQESEGAVGGSDYLVAQAEQQQSVIEASVAEEDVERLIDQESQGAVEGSDDLVAQADQQQSVAEASVVEEDNEQIMLLEIEHEPTNSTDPSKSDAEHTHETDQ